jgi:hypothetical protein
MTRVAEGLNGVPIRMVVLPSLGFAGSSIPQPDDGGKGVTAGDVPARQCIVRSCGRISRFKIDPQMPQIFADIGLPSLRAQRSNPGVAASWIASLREEESSGAGIQGCERNAVAPASVPVLPAEPASCPSISAAPRRTPAGTPVPLPN